MKQSASILLVDDNQESLIAMTHLLSALDVQIDTAENGVKAIELAQKNRYCVIVLDVKLPKLDGYQTALKIREIYSEYVTPVIFISGQNKSESDIARGYLSGAVDYLIKPVSNSVLLTKIKLFIDIYNQKFNAISELKNELNEAKVNLKDNLEKLETAVGLDALTSLPNRKQFLSELAKIISFCRNQERVFSILLISVDNFKELNEKLGYCSANQVLKSISLILRGQLRHEDIIARLGDDEFGIILADIESHEDSASVSEQICKTLTDGVYISDKIIFTTCSIGIAGYPNAGVTGTQLLDSADAALYRAKNKGKNNIQYYTDSLSKQFNRRALIERVLKSDILIKELNLVYQTIYDINTRSVYSYEALVRWNSFQFGQVTPNEFLPIAQSIGEMEKIDLWIIENACHQFAKWYYWGMTDNMFSFNLSHQYSFDSSFMKAAKDIIISSGLPPTKIQIDVKESDLMKNNAQIALFDELREVGLRIDIDDFGAGFTSLSKLHEMPVNGIKLDKGLVHSVSENKNKRLVVKAILSLSESLGQMLTLTVEEYTILSGDKQSITTSTR